MSTYQYYDFRSIDKPFTAEERKKLSTISSHASITSNSVSIEYDYGGNFKGDVDKLMHEYFDMMVYIACWGTRELMFRVPLSLVRSNIIEQYYMEEKIFIEIYKEQMIIDLFFGDDEISYWIEGKELLDDMLDLREELLRGDYRVLYLAWLKSIQWLIIEDSGNFASEDDLYTNADEELLESLEPPVPPGLAMLSEAEMAFVDFLEINEVLIEVAAQSSSPIIENTKTDLDKFVGLLPPDEQQEFLKRLSDGEANLTAILNKRLRELSRADQPKEFEIPEGKRSVKELILSTISRIKEKIAQERKEAERQRLLRLEEIELNKAKYWDEIIQLIEKKKPEAYDKAVKKLQDLKELADERKQSKQFKEKIDELMIKYSSRSGLKSRLRYLSD